MCGFLPPINSPTLQIPSGVQQFSSDTHYPEFSVRLQRVRTQSYKTALTSNASYMPPVLLPDRYKLGAPMIIPPTSGFLEWLTELRKTVYLLCPIYYQEYNSGTNGRDAQGKE